jgi:DNA-binding NarL/FixJ family response regulator
MDTLPIRVLIADDHPVVRVGLRHMLEAKEDLAVVGEAESASEAVELIRRLEPDVTMLDLEMEDVSNIEALRAVRAVAPRARIIVYTAFDEVELVMEAVALDVQGYLPKGASAPEIVRAIRSVRAGGTFLEPRIAAILLKHMRSNGATRPERDLSARELQVLRELSDGKSNRCIADRLFISERTVKFHIRSITRKLKARNRTEAVLIASQRGLLPEERRKD